MLTSKLKVLSVRLPEIEFRRLKVVAANRGVSLQDAVYQALGRWTLDNPKSNPEPLDDLEGSLANVDFEQRMGAEKDAEIRKDSRWS